MLNQLPALATCTLGGLAFATCTPVLSAFAAFTLESMHGALQCCLFSPQLDWQSLHWTLYHRRHHAANISFAVPVATRHATCAITSIAAIHTCQKDAEPQLLSCSQKGKFISNLRSRCGPVGSIYLGLGLQSEIKHAHPFVCSISCVQASCAYRQDAFEACHVFSSTGFLQAADQTALRLQLWHVETYLHSLKMLCLPDPWPGILLSCTACRGMHLAGLHTLQPSTLP